VFVCIIHANMHLISIAYLKALSVLGTVQKYCSLNRFVLKCVGVLVKFT
jgi:hypothetical protein